MLINIIRSKVCAYVNDIKELTLYIIILINYYDLLIGMYQKLKINYPFICKTIQF